MKKKLLILITTISLICLSACTKDKPDETTPAATTEVQTTEADLNIKLDSNATVAL